MRRDSKAASQHVVDATVQRRNNASARPSRIKEIALVSMLVVGVTSGGVVLGVYGLSPLVGELSLATLRESISNITALSYGAVADIAQQPNILFALGVTTTAAVLAYVVLRLWKRYTTRRVNGSSKQLSLAFSARTPRDVQVLAAAGKAPADIASRTRLPVDAVSMLLQLRQQ